MNSKDLLFLKEVIPKLTSSEMKSLKGVIKVYCNSVTAKRYLESIRKIYSNQTLISNLSRADLHKLKQYTEQALIVSVHSARSHQIFPLFQQKFEVSLSLLVVDLIRTMPAIKSTIILLNKCEEISKRYQFYNLLLDVLYFQSDYAYSSNNYYDIDSVKSKIEFYEKCRTNVNRSKLLYKDYFAQVVTKGINKGDINELKSSILEMKILYFETGSHLILLNLYLMQMELALLLGLFERGKEIGLNAINFLKSSHIVQTQTRIGYFYFNIADNELCALNFKDAVDFAITSKSYFREESLNRLVASDFLIVSSFFDRATDESKRELKACFELEVIESFPFYRAKFLYYQAIIYFFEKNFDECWKILVQHLELEKDKEGWRVWLSIMRIICQVERRDLVDVDMQVQSFKKYIKRWEQKAEIRDRDKLVFSVLDTLNKNKLDFVATAKEEKENLTVLAYPKGDLKWDPKSPELILFHEWFKSKLNSSSYKPDYKSYRSQKSVQKSNKYLADIERVKHLEP